MGRPVNPGARLFDIIGRANSLRAACPSLVITVFGNLRARVVRWREVALATVGGLDATIVKWSFAKLQLIT
jgi:hypothetical protein